LKWFLFFLVVSFLVGITAALVTIAWVAPLYMTHAPLYTIQIDPERQVSRTIDPVFERRVERQFVTVYNSQEKIGGEAYTRQAIFGTGVFFTTDGWFALYAPAYRTGDERGWEVMDYKGDIFDVQNVLIHPEGEIVYVKIDGSGFAVNNSPSWNDVGGGQFAWAFSRGEWYATVYGDAVWASDSATYPIDRPQHRWALSGSLERGAILLDRMGAPLGFVDALGRALSLEYIEAQYAYILEHGKVDTETLGLVGHSVDYVFEEGSWTPKVGFYVAESSSARRSDGIRSGDVIVAVEQQPVDEKVLWEQVTKSSSFAITILRDGEERDILIENRNSKS